MLSDEALPDEVPDVPLLSEAVPLPEEVLPDDVLPDDVLPDDVLPDEALLPDEADVLCEEEDVSADKALLPFSAATSDEETSLADAEDVFSAAITTDG